MSIGKRLFFRSSSRYDRLLVPAFFLVFLTIGLTVFDDYGVHWDEFRNQDFGRKWGRYVRESFQRGYPLNLKFEPKREHYRFTQVQDSDPKTIYVVEHDLIHGPVFEIFLAASVITLGLSDSRDVILIRHLGVFLLFFISVLIFYLFCKTAFRDWKIALLGCTFLVLHPRIFSHSFYNSVDIAFLSLYIITAYTLIKFLENKTYLRAIPHALASALLIDIRLAGLIVPFSTGLFLGAEFIASPEKKNIVIKASIYILLLAVLTFLFWPYLWANPIDNFSSSLSNSVYSHAKWPPAPWHYNFVWIFVTTPVVYSLFFVIGILSFLVSFAINPRKYFLQNPGCLIAILLFVLPIVLPIVFETKLFGGWRHHFFVYPMFVFVSLMGVHNLLSISTKLFGVKTQTVIKYSISALITISLVATISFMFKYHPHESAYSNVFAGKHKRLAKYSGALDSAGVTCRSVLEYILANNEGVINIDSTRVGRNNSYVLLPEDRGRLRFVKRQEADYSVTTHNWSKHREAYYIEEVDGEIVCGAVSILHNKNDD